MTSGPVLIRHPSVAARGICYGRAEMRLSADAPAQIAAAVAAAPRASRLISSPAARCLALAGALARAQGLRVEVDARLQELDFGSWEGRPWSGIPRVESDPWAADPLRRSPPGGETFAHLLDRVHAALAGLGDVLVITHAGPIRAARIAAGLTGFDAAFAEPVPHAVPLALPDPLPLPMV